MIEVPWFILALMGAAIIILGILLYSANSSWIRMFKMLRMERDKNDDLRDVIQEKEERIVELMGDLSEIKSREMRSTAYADALAAQQAFEDIQR